MYEIALLHHYGYQMFILAALLSEIWTFRQWLTRIDCNLVALLNVSIDIIDD